MMQRARNRRWLALVFWGAWLSAVHADTEIKAGGVTLTIPSPASDFAEVGDKLRTTLFELLLPSTNRLLSAYLPAQKLAELNAGKLLGWMDLYAMLEVPRQAEYADCTEQAFAKVLQSIDPSLANLDAKTVAQMEEEMNIHLKSIGTKPVEMGRPEILGKLFQKSNAAALAMLIGIKRDERSVNMACAFAVLRVKKRLIFAYVYRKYESPDEVIWLRKNLEAWCDAILTNNK